MCCRTPSWGANHPNFADRGLQLSRTAKALKIWMSVQTFAYYGISQYRLRLLLGAVDARLQRDDYHKGEPVKTIEYDTLQVERVLPISWQEHWPVEASDPGEKIVLEQERSDHVHRIGNLTLVSERLNPAMSNAPWKEKCPELKKHSHLRLNARLCQEADWNEQAIRTRGEWLAKVVSRIWPGPNSDTWE